MLKFLSWLITVAIALFVLLIIFKLVVNLLPFAIAGAVVFFLVKFFRGKRTQV